MRGLGFAEILMLMFIGGLWVVLVCVPAGMICRRTGRSPWLGAFALVPVANVLLLWFVAVAPWNSDQDEDGEWPLR